MNITQHCYAITGLAYIPPWSVNAGIVVGEKKTLVVDTGACTLSAQTIYGYASAIRPENKLEAVNTERHLDHLSGNGYFREHGVDIYGHPRIVRSQPELAVSMDEFNALIPNHVRRALHEEKAFFKDTIIANPNKLVNCEMELDLGGIEVRFLPTPGHTLTNLSIYVPTEHVLFAGDCLISAYLPNLEDGYIEDWRNWLYSLELIEELHPDIVVPGHGQILCGEEIGTEIERTRLVLREAMQRGVAPTLF